MDIVVQYTNARIRRMSWRRQKIAMAKRGKITTLTNAYPIAIGNGTPITDSAITFEVSFDPKQM